MTASMMFVKMNGTPTKAGNYLTKSRYFDLEIVSVICMPEHICHGNLCPSKLIDAKHHKSVENLDVEWFELSNG